MHLHADRRVTRSAAILLAAALTVSTAACANDTASASPSASSSASSTRPAGDDAATGSSTASAAAAPSGAPVDNAVTITMPGMSYEVSGTLHPGVGSITLVNADNVAHMMAFAHLKDGVTLDQAKGAFGQGEDAVGKLLAESPDTSYGTPDLLGPGESETVTALDLRAGHYLLACFLTAADGTPHWQMGMVGELDVEGDPATDKPASDGTIAIDDSGIALPDGFTGHGTYLVTNSGAKPHNLSMARLDAGTSLGQYAGHVGQAMGSGGVIDGGGGTLVGGIDSLAPGQSAYITLDLKSGHYGYISSADMTGPDLPAQSGEFDVA
jgi:plastocyanin